MTRDKIHIKKSTVSFERTFKHLKYFFSRKHLKLANYIKDNSQSIQKKIYIIPLRIRFNHLKII